MVAAACGATTVFAAASAVPAALAVFGVTLASSAGMVVLARRLAGGLGSVQRALVVLGGAVLIGLLGAALVPSAFWVRLRGATANQDAPTRATLGDAVHAAARERALSPGAGVLSGLRADGAPPSTPSAWRIDLGGARFDLLWIGVEAAALAENAASGQGLRRVLRRCSAAVLRRGRLVLELPDEACAVEAMNLLTGAERERSRVIRVQRGDERVTLLVMGGGVEAWWAALSLPAGAAAAVAAPDALRGALQAD
jgi:hypothetical protein